MKAASPPSTWATKHLDAAIAHDSFFPCWKDGTPELSGSSSSHATKKVWHSKEKEMIWVAARHPMLGIQTLCLSPLSQRQQNMHSLGAPSNRFDLRPLGSEIPSHGGLVWSERRSKKVQRCVSFGLSVLCLTGPFWWSLKARYWPGPLTRLCGQQLLLKENVKTTARVLKIILVELYCHCILKASDSIRYDREVLRPCIEPNLLEHQPCDRMQGIHLGKCGIQHYLSLPFQIPRFQPLLPSSTAPFCRNAKLDALVQESLRSPISPNFWISIRTYWAIKMFLSTWMYQHT